MPVRSVWICATRISLASLSPSNQTLWQCLAHGSSSARHHSLQQTSILAAKHPATSLLGALQVPFGEFTGVHYVALEFTNPMKWHPVTCTET